MASNPFVRLPLDESLESARRFRMNFCQIDVHNFAVYDICSYFILIISDICINALIEHIPKLTQNLTDERLLFFLTLSISFRITKSIFGVSFHIRHHLDGNFILDWRIRQNKKKPIQQNINKFKDAFDSNMFFFCRQQKHTDIHMEKKNNEKWIYAYRCLDIHHSSPEKSNKTQTNKLTSE